MSHDYFSLFSSSKQKFCLAIHSLNKLVWQSKTSWWTSKRRAALLNQKTGPGCWSAHLSHLSRRSRAAATRPAQSSRRLVHPVTACWNPGCCRIIIPLFRKQSLLPAPALLLSSCNCCSPFLQLRSGALQLLPADGAEVVVCCSHALLQVMHVWGGGRLRVRAQPFPPLLPWWKWEEYFHASVG